jgi:hypothetical protein
MTSGATTPVTYNTIDIGGLKIAYREAGTSGKPKVVDDIFFTPAGGDAFLSNLPKAEIRRLAAGYFAVEDHLDYISEICTRSTTESWLRNSHARVRAVTHRVFAGRLIS